MSKGCIEHKQTEIFPKIFFLLAMNKFMESFFYENVPKNFLDGFWDLR